MKIIGQNIGPQQTLDYTDEKIEPQQRGLNCGFFFFFFFITIKQKKLQLPYFAPKIGERKLTSFCVVYTLYQGAYLLFKRIGVTVTSLDIQEPILG